MSDVNIIVGGDTRQLERDIQSVLSRNFRLTGLDTRSFTQPLGKIAGQLGEFEKSLEASNARVVAFGASAGAIYLLGDAFKSMVKSTIDVERILGDINNILGETESNIKSFGNEVFNIANKTSQSFETAAEAALEFSRQGLGLEETAKRTAQALTLAKLSGLSAADSVEALTAAVNSYAQAGLTASQVVNKLAAVDAKYAVSSADLAEAIKRVGSSASTAGVSIDQLIALVTAAQQTTARGGAVIGNAFKTIFTRLERPKVLEDLQQLGIQTTNAIGQTLPLMQVLRNLAGTYDNLSSSQKSQAAELIGGVYQVNILKATLSDLSKENSIYAGALRESSSASNQAEQRVAKLTETLDSQINRVTNNLKRAGSIVGEMTIAPALTKVLSNVNSVLETFALGKEPEGIGEKAATAFLKGLGNFISGPGLVVAAVAAFKIFKNLAVFIGDAGRTILGLNEGAKRQAQMQAQVLALLQRNPQLYQQIASGAVSVEQAAAGYLSILRSINSELVNQQRLSAAIASTAMGMSGGRAGRSSRRSSGGFIPNFAVSNSDRMAERAGAYAGGYKPGRIVNSPVGGVMNTAEEVKYIPGFAQPFINPPSTSRAGKLHRANAIKQTGIDPYMYGGFIPNFGQSRKVKNLNYRRIPKVLALNIGLEDDDEIQLQGKVNHEIIPKKDKDQSPLKYEQYVINDVLKNQYEDNKRLKYKDSSAIDGFKGSNFLEVKSGSYNINEVIDKFYRAPAENAYGYNRNNFKWNKFTTGKRDKKYITGTLVTPSSGGFIPNFASYAGTAAIRAAVESGAINKYKIPGTKSYRFPDGSVASEAQVNNVASRSTKGTTGKAGVINFAGGKDFSTIPISSGSTQLIDAAYEALVQKSVPGLISAHGNSANFSLPFSGSGNSFIDFFNPLTKTFYEAKGGKFNASEVSGKFANVRTDLQNQLNKQLQQWKNVLIYNPNYAAGGFIPNFASNYVNEVMGLEKGLSGKKAIFDTKPFPHIRNSSQPTFASAIADHGGLSNALSDSVRNQKAAGLMSGGFIPNFADSDFDVTGISLRTSKGGAVSHKNISAAINKYINSIDLATTSNLDLYNGIRSSLKGFKLSRESMNAVANAAKEHAKGLRKPAFQAGEKVNSGDSSLAKMMALSMLGPALQTSGIIKEGSPVSAFLDKGLGALNTIQAVQSFMPSQESSLSMMTKGRELTKKGGAVNIARGIGMRGLGMAARLAGPIGLAYTAGELGKTGIEQFGPDGEYYKKKEAEKFKANIESRKTESGKAREYLASVISSKTAAEGFTGENLASARQGAAASTISAAGGLDKVKQILDQIPKGAGFTTKAAEALASQLTSLGQETNGLTEGNKALTASIIGEIQAQIKKNENLKLVTQIYNQTASSVASLAAKSTYLLTVYKNLGEKEKERAALLSKNLGGGTEALTDPSKSTEALVKLEQAFKVLKDPRFAGNKVERGRAAAKAMEASTALGIPIETSNLYPAIKDALDQGLTYAMNNNLRRANQISGGALGGTILGQIAGTRNQASRMNMSIPEMLNSQGFSDSGYRTKDEMKVARMSTKQIKNLEDEDSKAKEFMGKIQGMAQAAAEGKIPMEQFEAAMNRINTAANQLAQSGAGASLGKLIESSYDPLDARLRALAEKFATLPDQNITIGGNIQLTEEAMKYLTYAQEIYNSAQTNKSKDKNNEVKPPSMFNLGGAR